MEFEGAIDNEQKKQDGMHSMALIMVKRTTEDLGIHWHPI